MKHADLFLLLSNSEAYGIVVAEALALGTPCIVADATALHEFVAEPGCFGVDCPPDPEKVAQMIAEVFERTVQVGLFSGKIRAWEAVGRADERLYCRCIEGDLCEEHRRFLSRGGAPTQKSVTCGGPFGVRRTR